MAVKAAGSVTVASINDVASTTRYYLLQASTLTAPAAPTANPPGGSWAATEPTYSEGSTNSLYTCDQTVFSDGTWAYSAVSLSTSYEAAKAAYNRASAAAAAAAATDQHFWADADGAHVSSTGDHDLTGANLLLTSAKLAFRSALSELFSIVVSGTSAVISFLGGKLTISYGLWDSSPLDTSVIDASDNDLKITSDVGMMSGSFYDRSTFKGSYTKCTPHQYELVGDSFKISNNVSSGSINHVGLVVDPKRLADAIQPVVLYNGGAALDYDTAPGAGTAGTVTLSETAADFKEILIYLTDNNGKAAGVFTVAALPGATSVANGQTADCFGLEASDADNTSTFIRRTRYTVTGGTTLVPSNGGYVQFISASGVNLSRDGVNYLRVYRVTGRR